MTSIRARILAVALSSGMLSTLLAFGGVILVARAQIGAWLEDLPRTVGTETLARCEAEPERFWRDRGLVRVWAYDPDGVSRNLLAPELGDAFPSLEVGASTDLAWSGAAMWSRRRAHRIAESGPCAVLVGTTPDGDLIPLVRGASVPMFLGGLILALAAALVIAVRPLVVRTQRLDEAAARVGGAGYVPLGDTGGDELARVGRSLDAAHVRLIEDRAELAARQEALEQHLAAVAHDLRTPLASLQLHLEELAADHDGLGDAQLEVAYLEALADNLHQATRLRRGAGSVASEVDLDEIVERVGARFAILGRSRGVRVDVALPAGRLRVDADAALVERAIANLVHNALIHGEWGAPVVVAVDRLGGRFELIVVGGSGEVGPERLEELARRRLSEAPADRSRSGQGMGVAIVNEVAARLGWVVHWRADEEGGLAVELSGPLSVERGP